MEAWVLCTDVSKIRSLALARMILDVGVEVTAEMLWFSPRSMTTDQRDTVRLALTSVLLKRTRDSQLIPYLKWEEQFAHLYLEDPLSGVAAVFRSAIARAEGLNAWTRVAYDTALTEAGLFHPSGMRSSSKGEQLRSCLRLANVLLFHSLAAKELSLLGPDKPELPPLLARPAGLASLVKACPELAPELVDALALSL